MCLNIKKLFVCTGAGLPPVAADIAELRFAATGHVSTAFVVLDVGVAAVASFPAFHLGEVGCCLEGWVLRTVAAVVVGASA